MSKEAQKLIKQISKATNFVFHILLSYNPLTQNFGAEEAVMMSTFMNSTCNSTLHKKSIKRKNKQALLKRRSTNLRNWFVSCAKEKAISTDVFLCRITLLTR